MYFIHNKEKNNFILSLEVRAKVKAPQHVQ